MQLTKEQIETVIQGRLTSLREQLKIELDNLNFWNKKPQEIIDSLADCCTPKFGFYGIDSSRIDKLVLQITTIRSLHYSLLLELHQPDKPDT